MAVRTDDNGEYGFVDVPAGLHEIRGSGCILGTFHSYSGTILVQGPVTLHDFRLEPSSFTGFESLCS